MSSADVPSADAQRATTARSAPDRVPDDPVPPALPGPPAKHRDVPRALLERYEDVRFVGEGGMGTVYRGIDPRLGRVVALKLLKGDDPELWRRFIAEARAQAKIQHEHVCRVYEAGQADGEPFIAMQYIDGEPLSRMAERLTVEQCVKVMREVSAAVHEAHRLGMIHRDIKPANVLIERREDGTLKPYIMDFGLAREVEERGQTRTGAIVGTPAYMPPEQARGDVRSMDRRSDVYSLGATLYDVIAGRPPFVAEHPWKLLLMVAYEEAPALGKVKKGVQEDLETIVMKCLEREPLRRYESARALAEDLQRLLDGEPIRGKRASPGYVLWKKAKKHKLATTFAGVTIIAALLVSVAWVRAGQRAAEQARLAQALGEDVKGMELFLRNAYSMPLHDVERERALVRGRLAKIEQRMAGAGKVGDGPGHYALGRGALALGDPEGARSHLEKALAAGYSSPYLEYALGQALGELFRRALEETRRITNGEAREKRVRELEVTLRDPALSHLRAAVAAEIEVPAYAEGLIALYEGKNEEALAKGREAFEKAPWMYEAKKLQGDALYAMGSQYRHDAAFDYEKMISYFDPAAKAYAEAADAARSDPETHRAECELREKMGLAAAAKALSAAAAFDAAVASCDRAVRASGADGRARVQRALALSARLSTLEEGDEEGWLLHADAAVRAAEEAVQGSPDDVMAHYAAARARFHQANRLHQAGREVSMEPAIAAYREVVELDPQFTWAVNELGRAHLVAAEWACFAGRDARAALQDAERYFDQASALDPAFSLAVQYKVRVSAVRLEDELARGTSSDASVEAVFDALRRIGSGAWLIAYWSAKAQVLRGKHELAMGKDPRASAEAARSAIGAFSGSSPQDPWLLVQVVESLLLEAEQTLREGRSARAPLDEARRASRDVIANKRALSQPWRVLAARIELSVIRDGSQRGDVREQSFDEALSLLQPVLSKGTTEPAPYGLAAEIFAAQAAWLAKRGGDPGEATRAGLARVEEALSRNPRMAAALETKGSLLLVEARAARGGAARAAAAARAKEAFEAALRENPRRRREHEHGLGELAGLVR